MAAAAVAVAAEARVTKETKPPAKPAKAERERRLAEALRANLKRRKAAARPEPAGEAEPQAEAGKRDLE
jgi:hypothetical protein